MFNFWKSKLASFGAQARAKETEKLIISLKKVAKPKLSSENRDLLRKNILYAVTKNNQPEFMPASLRHLGLKVNRVAAQVSLPAVAAARIKERLFGFIERNPLFGLSAAPHFKYLRMALSSLLLFVFSFTAVFVMPYQVPQAYARTYLDEVKGDVFVSREGRLISAMAHFALQEGDKIVTKTGGLVTVHFFDDSVSRLGENTSLEIKKLYTEPMHPMVTGVQLFLKEGRLWSRVINMIDDRSEFTVETVSVRANVSKKAAFDLYVGGDVTQLAVFDNVVDIVSVDGDTAVSTVVAGYSAAIDTSQSSNIELSAIDPEDPDVQATTKWVAANMRSDRAYDRQIVTDVAANVLNAGTTDEANIPVLANPEIEKIKIAFLDNYSELTQAEAMFVAGDRQQGLELLRNFSSGVSDIMAQMPTIEISDAFNAGILRNLMNEKIAVQLKDLSTFVPGDKLYAVKDALREVELMMAADDAQSVQIKLSQAESKLFEIQELLKENKVDFATSLIRNYQKEIDQVVLRIDIANTDIAGILVPLVTQQVQQIKVLTAMEEALSSSGQEDFRLQISQIRVDSLKKLLDALEKLRGTIPVEVSIDLKGIFDTYFDTDSIDADMINATFERLLEGGEGLNFIQPDADKLPSELGVVMIVTVEATPDITNTLPETALGTIDAVPVVELVPVASTIDFALAVDLAPVAAPADIVVPADPALSSLGTAGSQQSQN